MKKRGFYHLLVIAGVVLLVGLIASCSGDEDSEPQYAQYQIIESRQCTGANRTEIWNELFSKHIGGRIKMGGFNDGKTIMGETNYWAMWDLIYPELAKKPSTVDELCMVLKVDQYRGIGFVYIDKGDGKPYISGYIYNN
jgi:hypothetical protein